jgi:1-acyl-sn-glycerol-3-phosphate acyltransferase
MESWKLDPAHDLNLQGQERWRSLRRESDLLESSCHFLWGLGVRTFLKIWHRFEVMGRENLPAKPPFVLVGNHSSHLDALLLTAPLPLNIRDQVFALAAGDVFFEKALTAAFATTMINALPLWRRKTTARALVELRERLVEEPCAYILFPEGGRTRDGRLLPFKPGIGMLLAGTAVPAVPCYVDGAFAACPAGSGWPRPKKIRMRVGPALQFPDAPSGREGWEQVAARLQEAVQQLGNTFASSSGAAEQGVPAKLDDHANA